MSVLNAIPTVRISKKALLFTIAASALLFIGCAATNDVKKLRKKPKGYLGQIELYFAEGQYDKALAEVNKALSKMPNNAVMYNVRGEIYYEKGEYDRAISDFSKAIELKPRRAVFYDNRGYAYWRTLHYDEAIADHSRAIELDPENAFFYAQRGHAWYLKGDYDRAIEDANKAIELSGHPEGYHVRGHALYMKGEHGKAISDFSEAIKLTDGEDNTVLYMCRGVAYYGTGAYEKAYADISKAIEQKPANNSYYNELAWRLATCPDDRYRDGQRAVELSRESIKRTNLKSQKALYLDTLAAAYAETGKFEKAVNTQIYALSLLRETKAASEIIEGGNKRLASYKAQKPWREK